MSTIADIPGIAESEKATRANWQMRLIVSALGYCRSPASFDFTLTDTSSDAGVNRVEFLSIGTLCFKVEKNE